MPNPIAKPPANAAPIARAARSGRRRTTADRGSRAHSGHLKPTGVSTMQSGQIGRPQLEHETRVSRPGWR